MCKTGLTVTLGLGQDHNLSSPAKQEETSTMAIKQSLQLLIDG
jgi:hypothetical protein